MALQSVKICDFCKDLAVVECAACGKDCCTGRNPLGPPTYDGGHAISLRIMMRAVTPTGDPAQLSRTLLHLCIHCAEHFITVKHLPEPIMTAGLQAVADAIKAYLAERALRQ